MDIPNPTRNVDPYTLSNDENGFSVYSFVLYATEEQRAAVKLVRDAVKVKRSMLPAHVTVKGPICEIPTVEAVQVIVDEVVSEYESVPVLFDETRTARTLPNAEVIGSQAIQLTPELVDIHIRLIEALDPISVTAYGGEAAGKYSPHLTVYHEPEPGFEQVGETMLTELQIGHGFISDRVSLVGHVGRPFRGEWKIISEHRFGAAD